MLQDTRADAPPAGAPPLAAGAGHDLGAGQEPEIGGDPGTGDSGITEELLVEDVSIDGMCGVY